MNNKFNPGICSACEKNVARGILKPCDTHKIKKTKKAICPICGKEIDALMKDVQAEEHFRVWIDVDGSYQEKSVFYDIYESFFSCAKCLQRIDGINHSEDATKFLKGEKF